MTMLRTINSNISSDTTKHVSKTGPAKSNQNKSTISTKSKTGRGLKVVDPNRIPLGNKPKPLHASTNTIHSLKQKLPSKNIISENNLKSENNTEPSGKKAQGTLTENKIKPDVKVDENDVSPFVTNPYDPLREICPFDEELYQKVLKLEIADDGLPTFNSDEPFDF